MANEELINRPLIKAWLSWGLVWLMVFPLFGVLVSTKFHNPEFLGDASWLTFGRLRPVHVNGVIFGAFSTNFLGLLYYYVARLCGVRMYKEEWGWWLLWLWNIFLVVGSISFMMGYNSGLEAGEYEWPLNILRFVALGLVTVQVLGTIWLRKERRFFVGLWCTAGAVVLGFVKLILGGGGLPDAGEGTGGNSAALPRPFIP